MDFVYCSKKCQIGISKSAELLNMNDSVYDAAFDFNAFAEECFKTCPHKEEHIKKGHHMKVCCISAKARHGKDTAAEILKEYLEYRGQRVLITHFADLLKFICRQFFGWDGNKDEAGRTLLQYIGTDVVGKKNPAYWAEFIISILKMFEKEWDYVLIPDCRYPIEASTVRNNFETVLLRVERPDFDNGLTPEQKKHPSEVAMDNYGFDAVLYNNGSLEELSEKVRQFAEDFLLAGR